MAPCLKKKEKILRFATEVKCAKTSFSSQCKKQFGDVIFATLKIVVFFISIKHSML